jgi:hypothetical protein
MKSAGAIAVFRGQEEASPTGSNNSTATCRPISKRSTAIIVELAVHGIVQMLKSIKVLF